MKHVLIVDDETRLLQSIEAGLKSYQDEFRVLTASNGKEAVQFLQLQRVDLVVTDLRMPEMDGFELLAYLSTAQPFMPNIVMTAFSTPEIEERLNAAGTLKLLEKPIDIEKLAESIRDGLRQDGSEGGVAGFYLANFLQLLAMEQKTCLLNVRSKSTHGYIYLHQGEIHAAVANGMKGEEAVYHLLASEYANITFQKLPKRKIQQMIKMPLMSLLIEAMRRKDEKAHELNMTEHDDTVVEAEREAEEDDVSVSEPLEVVDKQSLQNQGNTLAPKQELNIGDIEMGKLEDTLSRLSDIEGFMAAGVFTPNGEMASQINISNLKLAEIGSLANDVLLKAQKATDIMNVGRGTLVHVEAPKAHVIARCLNESDDFSQTQAGKAHIHMVMILGKDGNLAMAKMKLESIIQEAAEAFR